MSHPLPLADTVDPYLQKLFETGVDEMSWDDMDELQDSNFPWPDVAEAQAFRLKVGRGGACASLACVRACVRARARATSGSPVLVAAPSLLSARVLVPVPVRVCAYVAPGQCKAAVEGVINTMTPPCEKEVTMNSPLWALFMGFEHEKIHLETSSVLFRQVGGCAARHGKLSQPLPPPLLCFSLCPPSA